MTVLKKPCYATSDSAIITAVTTHASSNFLSTQSDACFHSIIFIVHMADQDFTHEMVFQNSGLLHKILSYGLYQRTRLYWHSFPSHPDPSEFSTNALGFIGILFQSQPNPSKFSTNALGSIGILFQVIRIPRNSLPTHSASLKFSPKSSRFIVILFQRIRSH